MKKILVTGISKGIGKAICTKLVKEGYFVIGTYNTSKDEAEKLKSELTNVELHQVDFSERNQTLELIEKIKNQTFYAIVNNAGIIQFESWNEFTMETWDKTMEVNLNTPMLISHSLKDSIEENGSIINISSTDGLVGSISSIAYSASKAALINLTKSLANVFSQKNIRVNSIAPGWIGDGMDSPAIKDAKWLNPLSRTGNYEEIANVVGFLISSSASFINGTNIIADGGSEAVNFVLKKEDELLNAK